MNVYIKNSLLILFFIIFSYSTMANTAKEILETTLIPEDSRNTLAPPLDNRIKKAKFEKGDCLMYLKDGESYWSYRETQVLKVEDIGEKNLKVRMFGFLKKTDKWILSPAESLDFIQQSLYKKVDCPSLELKLTDEELDKLKNKDN
jgi:hypothetical protein